ncbi:MAG: HEAT repeat domain-containing protein [Actinobacteria bacterium]|nr:HEAT repeat domain-containing protein [Actinomycetota bacterium]
MQHRPDDLDLARAAVARLGLVGDASSHLTSEVAMHLPFEALTPYKQAVKRFFSTEDWADADADALAGLVTPHVDGGWHEHDLGRGIRIGHGIRDGRYVLWATGGPPPEPTVFDRAFSGPVRPIQTPHPRKVKFAIGGEPAPGRWYRRGEEDVDDPRVAAVLEDDSVTDVMVAGDFVTVGLGRGESWEDRLEGMLARITELFWDPDRATPADDARTREELVQEGLGTRITGVRPEDLHLLDPDDGTHREALITALGAADPRARRAAVATLSMSADEAVATAALLTGYSDTALMVRRTAVDAAADLEDDEYRPLFEAALRDPDPWTRWRAVRAIAELGVEASREPMMFATLDDDFRVRFEAIAALREIEGA